MAVKLPDSSALGGLEISTPSAPRLSSPHSGGAGAVAAGIEAIAGGIEKVAAADQTYQSVTGQTDWEVAKTKAWTNLSAPESTANYNDLADRTENTLRETAAPIIANVSNPRARFGLSNAIEKDIAHLRAAASVKAVEVNQDANAAGLADKLKMFGAEGARLLVEGDEEGLKKNIAIARELVQSNVATGRIKSVGGHVLREKYFNEMGELAVDIARSKGPEALQSVIDKLKSARQTSPEVLKEVGPQSSNPVDAIFSAIHQQESGGGRNTSTSVTGARGDMQIQPGTWAQYAKPGEDINNPADNKTVGKRIIADLYEKSGGDPARVAVGYFSGPGNIAPPGSPTPWKADKADPTGKTVSSYVADVTKRLGSQGSAGPASADNVIEKQSDAVRSQPIAPELKSQLSSAATQAGVTLEVVSGGQSETGPFRVGSKRHDNGGAADVLVRDAKTGRLLDHTDPNDQKVFAKLAQSAAQAGITGIGAGEGYMNNNTIHLGGGVDAVWGAKGSKDNAPPWLREAYAAGRAAQQGGQKFAALGTGTATDATSAPANQNIQVAENGPPRSVYNLMDPLKREQLILKAEQGKNVLEGEALKASALRKEQYERRFLDASVGKGTLPMREEIETDPTLKEGHKNDALRQWGQYSKDVLAFRENLRRFTAGEKFNPYEKDDRDAADSIYHSLNGDDAALTVVVQRTGVMPVTAAKQMRAALISNDPRRVADAMTRASNAIAMNQNIMTGFDGADDLEKNAVKFRTYVHDFGMKAEDAANRMIREQTPEFKASVNAKIKSEDIDGMLKKKLSINDISGQFDTSPLGIAPNPQVGFSARTRDVMFDQYATLVKEHYLDTASGDFNTAKKLAANDLKKTWGVSEINGSKVVMQYPPERAPAYHGIDNSSGLIAKEAVKTIKDETGQDVDAKSIRIVPIPGVTAQAYKSGQIPPYALSWEDKNGVLQMLKPGRAFVADPSAMRQQQTLEREGKFNQGREAAGAERMVAPDPRVPFGVPQ